MKAKKPEKTYEPVPAGNHIARLYQIIHIGTNEFEYMGETKKSDKVRLTFELCNEKKVFKEGDEPKPFSVSREFGLTMGKKSKLRPFVEGFIGTGLSDDEAYAFDLDELVGKPCMLTVIHETKNDNTYANILSASPMPKGIEAPDQVNESSIIDVDSSPLEVIEALPEFIKVKIQSSEEYQGRLNHQANMEKAGRIEPPSILKGRLAADEDIEPAF